MKHDFEILQNKVSTVLTNAERGHDYWHALRVVQNARLICAKEGGNSTIIEASAWVHDIIDDKFSTESDSKKIVADILYESGFQQHEIETIMHIITHISFKGGISNTEHASIELHIVQDADRLDAMGAIGIARAFHYGGFKNRELYNPAIAPQTYTTAEEYRNSQGHTINHFYEKLFTLQTRMNTPTAKHIAQERHVFMETFVEQFLHEWNGII
ncbi:MAG: putative hydrolase [Bacteroidetes bacterium ADurb.Bin217]|nr:MAG: putative hydrolase [Bacteroidetes bacterium ADurb.Bin217]